MNNMRMTSDYIECKNLTAHQIADTIIKAISKYGEDNVSVETQLQDDVIRLYLECRRAYTPEELWAMRKRKNTPEELKEMRKNRRK